MWFPHKNKYEVEQATEEDERVTNECSMGG